MSVLGDDRRNAGRRPRTTASRQLGRLLALVALADVVVLVAAVVLAWDLRINIDVWIGAIDPDAQLSVSAGPWIVAVWMLFLAAQGAYAVKTFGTGPEEFKIVTLASVLAAGLVSMFCYLVGYELSRGFLVLSFLIGIPLLLVERYVVRQVLHRLRSRGVMLHRVVAVGGPSALSEVVSVLHRERYAGYTVVGACVPRGITVDPDVLSVPHLGAVEDVRRVCDEVGADTVLVARGGYSSSSDLRRIAWDLEESDLDLVVVPSLTDVAGPRIHMRPVAGLPLLHVEGPQADEAGGLTKRVFDVAAALVCLLLLAPVMVAVMVMIKVDDGGPIFFRQARVGRDGASSGC